MRSVVCCMTLLLLAGSLKAQSHPNTREGFWIGFGLGGGSIGADCHDCSTDRTSGASGHLQMGGTVSRHIQLGGELNGWGKRENGIDESMGFGSFVMLWYPSATGAFFFKFGIGGMTYTAQDDFGNDLTAKAPSGSFGLGYDIRVARNFSITPFFNALASSAVEVRINGHTVPTGEDISGNLVQVGFGVKWH